MEIREAFRETAAGKRAKVLCEANRAFEDRMRQKVLESMRQEVEAVTGVDVLDEGFRESEVGKRMLDIFDPDFSIKGLIESVKKGCRGIREANVAGTVQQFLRAGLQISVNSIYQKVETTWDGMYQSVPSSKAIELYAAAFRASFPTLKSFGQEPSQAQIAGMDIQVPNKQKASKLLTITEDLIMFDQSNQVQAQAQQIAENFPIFSDAHAVGRFLSNDPAGSYPVLDPNNDPVPASATGTMAGETTWPFNGTGFTNGKGKNALSSPTAATYRAVIQLRAMERQMLDPLGHKMAVKSDTLWSGVGLSDGFELMFKSALWPSTASIAAVTGAGALGTDMAIGTQHADNLLKGKYNLVDSIWLPNLAWGICQAGKGFIKQVVKPVRVSVENPLSGPSFLLRATRYLIDEIWTYEYIEPRFTLRGSDGSA